MSQSQSSQISGIHLKSLVVPIWDHCLSTLCEIRNRRNARKALDRLKPRDLRDIGLTKYDVETALSAPLSQDAATGLRSRTRRRSDNW